MSVKAINKYDSPIILTGRATIGPVDSSSPEPTGTKQSFVALNLDDMDTRSNRWTRIDALRFYVHPVEMDPTEEANNPFLGIEGGMPGVFIGFAGFRQNFQAQAVRGIQQGFFVNMALRAGQFELCEDVPLPLFSPRNQTWAERENVAAPGSGSDAPTADDFMPRRNANHYTVPLEAPVYLPPNQLISGVFRRPADGLLFRSTRLADPPYPTSAQAFTIEFAAVGRRVREPDRATRQNLKVPWFDVARSQDDAKPYPEGVNQSVNNVKSREIDLRNDFKTDLHVNRMFGRQMQSWWFEARDADVEDRKIPSGIDGLINGTAAGSVSTTVRGGFDPLIEIRDSDRYVVVPEMNWRNLFPSQHNSVLVKGWKISPLKRLMVALRVPDVPAFVASRTSNALSEKYFSMLQRTYVGIAGWREERM